MNVYNKILKNYTRSKVCLLQSTIWRKANKKSWSTIHEIVCKTKTTNGIKSTIKDSGQIRDLTEFREKFNEFFVSIGPNLSSNINCGTDKNLQTYLNGHILTSCHFNLISEKIYWKIHTLAAHKNIIRSRWNINKNLKLLSPGLIKPLTLIINQSLIIGIFPEKLKLANVIPLYKKGDTLIMGNYRPITLLTLISKLFEKVVFEQLSDYFSHNKYFHKGQYGFRE